jgi:hypothetical protein
MESEMPSYTFQVLNGDDVFEISDVDLPDSEVARHYAIRFASELFRSHHELCAGEWERCDIHVLTAKEEIFATTVPQAALIERDDMRQHGMSGLDN